MDHHHLVTAANIDQVRLGMAAVDQAAALAPGCETWSIWYGPARERGQMTRWPSGRGALAYGGDSCWGEWDGGLLTLDEPDPEGNPEQFDVHGDPVHPKERERSYARKGVTMGREEVSMKAVCGLIALEIAAWVAALGASLWGNHTAVLGAIIAQGVIGLGIGLGVYLALRWSDEVHDPEEMITRCVAPRS